MLSLIRGSGNCAVLQFSRSVELRQLFMTHTEKIQKKLTSASFDLMTIKVVLLFLFKPFGSLLLSSLICLLCT